MSYFKRYLQLVLSSGLISGFLLNALGLHPFVILLLVLLAILPALLIPHLLITGISAGGNIDVF
jgi:hypothetical protein